MPLKNDPATALSCQFARQLMLRQELVCRKDVAPATVAVLATLVEIYECLTFRIPMVNGHHRGIGTYAAASDRFHYSSRIQVNDDSWAQPALPRKKADDARLPCLVGGVRRKPSFETIRREVRWLTRPILRAPVHGGALKLVLSHQMSHSDTACSALRVHEVFGHMSNRVVPTSGFLRRFRELAQALVVEISC